MFIRSILYVQRTYVVSFFLWIALSTVIPQLLTKYGCESDIKARNGRTSTVLPSSASMVQNSTIYFIIAHPDDEVMFFSPSVIEFSKVSHNNKVKLLCFSKGDADSDIMGNIRTRELYESARILGISQDNVVLMDEFKDGMNENWDTKRIAEILKSKINHKASERTVLVTFDQDGVSGHPNHKALYYGVLHYIKLIGGRSHDTRVLILQSLNFLEKYSSTFLTNVELFVENISRSIFSSFLIVKINISFFNSKYSTQVLKIYSDLNMLSVSYAAMAYGHYSQMVWFRYGWLLLSRYLTYNHLIEL